MKKETYKMGEQFKREFAMDGKKYFENLYLYLTDACNMNCKHCYLGERLVEKEQMPLSSVKAHLDFWREVGSTKVCFLGGEPTLYEHLHESVDYARALNYNKVIINTNLTNYAYKIMKEFTPEEITYIQTSLDGATSTTHDTIRRPGAFSETTESISKLAKQGHDVRLIMTVNRFNINEVIPMIKLAHQLGCSLVKFHLMSEIGNAENGDIRGLSADEWYHACLAIKEYAKSANRENIKISYQPAYAAFGEVDSNISENYHGCIGKMRERMSIFPNGDGYICSFLFDRKDSFVKLKDNVIEIRDQTIEKDFITSQCAKCSRCGFDGCKAETVLAGKDACTDLYYPVCRLWKVEL